MVNFKGLRVNPNNFAAHWRRDRKSLGVDGWCLHELRHSYLSMLALEGVHPKVMQDLAGHADSRTTMDIYTHVNMSQKRCAADALEAVMFGSGPVEPKPIAAPSFTVIRGSRDADENPSRPKRPKPHHRTPRKRASRRRPFSCQQERQLARSRAPKNSARANSRYDSYQIRTAPSRQKTASLINTPFYQALYKTRIQSIRPNALAAS